jgi:ubiquinone/menaquinone biosynthesis C-methylase UbiE
MSDQAPNKTDAAVKPLQGTAPPLPKVTATHRRLALREHFDAIAPNAAKWRKRNRYYHSELVRLLRLQVPVGSTVLEIGCGAGELLAGLEPSLGVGIDLSPKMAQAAKQNHPALQIIAGDAHALPLAAVADVEWDAIIVSDLVGHLEDVWLALSEIKKLCAPHTRLIVTHYSHLWEPPLRIAEWTRLKMPTPQQNWLSSKDLLHLMDLAGFETVTQGERMLWPKWIPLLSAFLNRFLGKMPGLRHLCVAKYLVARRRPEPADRVERSVTVLIPCRNERGNIQAAIDRTAELGTHTELLFVDGNSSDGTVEEIERVIKAYPDRDIKLLHQGDGTGKGDAVRKGFAAATGELLMILDADLTMPPEELPRFYELAVTGKGEFVMGSRLIYPMEGQAMRFFNMLGNKGFSMVFSWLLDQRIKDTLCGTKVLLKSDYDRIVANRHYFGDFDPFGDFDLIFGAAKLNKKIVEIPIRYRDRTYGVTNISRWKHGWLLLRMCVVAFRKLKLT